MSRLSTGRPAAAGFITGRSTHHSVTKRLWCSTHASMQDAHKVTPRSVDYELACGCVRSLLTSERGAERNEAAPTFERKK